MRTVLLAWELGAGFGHVVTLRRLAARLARHGFRLVAAVKNVIPASALAGDGVEIFQAPVWPATFQTDKQRAARSSATLGDTLGDLGLADEQALRTLLAAWDKLYALIAPDLVIADYAPFAALVARARIPLALVGTGFTLPPAEMEHFPLLHQLAAPVWPEQQLLETVNSALRGFDLKPLQRLPQLFDGDIRWVQTFPLLDPYNLQRKHPAEGPLLDRMPQPRRPKASEILVYISGKLGGRSRMLEALKPVAGVRIYAPGIPGVEQERLAGLGLRIEKAPFRLADDLASARLVIHHGSAGGVSAEALLAGVPQLILSLDVEKDLTGEAMERAGIGKLLKIHDPAVSLSTETVEALARDSAIADTAKEIGGLHRLSFQDADPLSVFETGCLNLVNKA